MKKRKPISIVAIQREGISQSDLRSLDSNNDGPFSRTGGGKSIILREIRFKEVIHKRVDIN